MPTRVTATQPNEPISALFIRPQSAGPYPAVLYIHAHGHRYAIGAEELLDGRPALPCGAYAPDLAASGMAALCLDLPCFGARQHHSESALAKRLLWQGDTLFGVMLRELAGALDYLATRADVDATRIGALGLSMGATLAWWLAALDERVRAVAELCCLAEMARLIERGAHDLHGLYLTVPGLAAHHTTQDIAALIAPRPHLCAIGRLDPLTPEAAVDPLLDHLRGVYSAMGAADAFETVIEHDSGHVETPKMRRAVLTFLQRHLHAVAG